MNRNTLKVLWKISILTIFIIGLFHIADFIPGEAIITWKSENKYYFKSADSSTLWNVWVALSTNVWIWYSKRKNTPIESYKDIPMLWEIIWDPSIIAKEILEINMLTIKDYLNLIKTDVPSMLDSSINREDSLENFISELKLRYKNWVSNWRRLTSYSSSLLNSLNWVQTKINSLKEKISLDFKNSKAEESYENIENYEKLKAEYNRYKINIVYINNFIKQYNFLNSYNAKLLDTLINNKEAIINQWHITIPDSGSDLIKEYKLIYDEAEWKKIKNKEKEED